MSLLPWFRRSAITLGLALAAAATLLPARAFAQAAGDYRSAATGNWNANATWQRFDGTSWVAASATPTSTDGAITIRTGNTVTISANGLTYDQVTVDAGGQLTIASTITDQTIERAEMPMSLSAATSRRRSSTLSSMMQSRKIALATIVITPIAR